MPITQWSHSSAPWVPWSLFLSYFCPFWLSSRNSTVAHRGKALCGHFDCSPHLPHVCSSPPQDCVPGHDFGSWQYLPLYCFSVDFFGHINSSINPIIYFLAGSQWKQWFREPLIEVFQQVFKYGIQTRKKPEMSNANTEQLAVVCVHDPDELPTGR